MRGTFVSRAINVYIWAQTHRFLTPSLAPFPPSVPDHANAPRPTRATWTSWPPVCIVHSTRESVRKSVKCVSVCRCFAYMCAIRKTRCAGGCGRDSFHAQTGRVAKRLHQQALAACMRSSPGPLWRCHNRQSHPSHAARAGSAHTLGVVGMGEGSREGGATSSSVAAPGMRSSGATCVEQCERDGRV